MNSPRPQAGSLGRVAEQGGNAAKQAAALANAEAAAAQVTDGLFLDLDTLWVFVQEVNFPRLVCGKKTESFRTSFLFHRLVQVS